MMVRREKETKFSFLWDRLLMYFMHCEKLKSKVLFRHNMYL